MPGEQLPPGHECRAYCRPPVHCTLVWKGAHDPPGVDIRRALSESTVDFAQFGLVVERVEPAREAPDMLDLPADRRFILRRGSMRLEEAPYRSAFLVYWRTKEVADAR